MNIHGIHESYQIHATTTSSHLPPKAEEVAVSKIENSEDMVQISPKASFQSKLSAEVRRYAEKAEENISVSAERIAELKTKYQGDSCPVSGVNVANAILAKVCGVYRLD